MNVPAATAVPITPATFGPIACIKRKFVGSASEPTFWDTRALTKPEHYMNDVKKIFPRAKAGKDGMSVDLMFED